MIAIYSAATTIERPEPDCLLDEAQLAAVAFLAHYSGRTLDAFELYRSSLEERGLAASTIDRRLYSVRLLPVRSHRRTIASTSASGT